MSTLMDMQSLPIAMSMPLMTREAFARAIGLPLGVLIKQTERGYWPTLKIGRRIFVNLEVIRIKAAERAVEFAL